MFLFTDPIFFGKTPDAGGLLLVVFYALFCLLLLVSVVLRKIPPFNYIYAFVKLLMIFLLISLGLNFVKDNVKKWWDK
jgi:uncharacterized membrane protein